MVNRTAVSRAVKVAVVLGVRYGPQIVQAVRRGKEPAQELVTDRLLARSAHRRALEHAKTVLDGSVLRVTHEGKPYQVVFSGDECVGVYPPTTASYAELLRHSDLARRERPATDRRVHLRRPGRRPDRH